MVVEAEARVSLGRDGGDSREEGDTHLFDHHKNYGVCSGEDDRDNGGKKEEKDGARDTKSTKWRFSGRTDERKRKDENGKEEGAGSNILGTTRGNPNGLTRKWIHKPGYHYLT
ncbi:hypothetical protein L2E82_17366 [Cichorium intybus]|uniref:Uncharacterized protein n=1 Tax=Cichorium intybus TaxID=13427 RepID=A0ACB9F7K0_CICIN|nr:hypothetical protein L2E82_17366 [Cichorium intybus]